MDFVLDNLLWIQIQRMIFGISSLSNDNNDYKE